MRYIQSFKTYVTSYNSREVLVGWLCSGRLPFMDVCIVSGVPNIKVAFKQLFLFKSDPQYDQIRGRNSRWDLLGGLTRNSAHIAREKW